jgi:hypothetical protein
MTTALVAIAFVAIIAVILLRGIGVGIGGASPEARLLRVCQGNRDQVERLILAEMRRNESLSRQEAASRALQRFQRDNR